MESTWRAEQAALSAAYQAFCVAADQLAPAVRMRVGACGSWTAKDVVVHLAAWDREATRRFAQLQAGSATDVSYDVDAFNAAAIAAQEHLSWEQAWAELHAAHAAFQQAIVHVSAPQARDDPRFAEWVSSRGFDYREHAAQLRVWDDSSC